MRVFSKNIIYSLIILKLLFLPEAVILLIVKAIKIPLKAFLYSRHRMMMKNMKIALKNKSKKEIIKISNKVWENIGYTFLISIKYIFSKDKMHNNVIIKDKFKLKEYLDKSKSAIVFTAHLGNWELLAQKLVIEGYKVAAIVREFRNKKANFEVSRIRKYLGGEVFFAHELKKIFSFIKNGGIVYILPDQHIVEGEVRVNFLGRPAFTSPAITILAKRTGCKIFPMFCIQERNKYYIYIEDEYKPKFTNDLKADIEFNTEKINDIISNYIKRYPEQWFWLHNRWKEK